jgi:hypothetical protein
VVGTREFLKFSRDQAFHSISKFRARHFFNDGLARFRAISPRLSAPDRDPAEVYEKERREMRQKSDAELLKVRAMGNEYKKELAQEELQHREHARNVQTDRRIAKWTLSSPLLPLSYPSIRAR